MANCRDIEPQLTAYVDDEVDAAGRGSVEAHLERCPPCRRHVDRERATHELLASHRAELRGHAPAALRSRCAAQCAFRAGRPRVLGRDMMVPLSLAATVVLALGLFAFFGWGSSVDTYAAQLADDHVKCFQSPPASTADVAWLARAWQEANGWPLVIPPDAEAEKLTLLGVRRCGSSRGSVAHLMYRWKGEPLSAYVLNGSVEDVADASRHLGDHEVVATVGEQTVLWTSRGRTYAVVSRGPQRDVERVAAYLRTVIE